MNHCVVGQLLWYCEVLAEAGFGKNFHSRIHMVYGGRDFSVCLSLLTLTRKTVPSLVCYHDAYTPRLHKCFPLHSPVPVVRRQLRAHCRYPRLPSQLNSWGCVVSASDEVQAHYSYLVQYIGVRQGTPQDHIIGKLSWLVQY